MSTTEDDDAIRRVEGPAKSTVIEVGGDECIPFGNLTKSQKTQRDRIRTGCQRLEPSNEQVLHATFFGAKHANADVENLLIYNIDSFRVAGRNGIRFEHAANVPPTGGNRFSYRYALAPRSAGFTHQRQERVLASFDWIDLGALSGEKKLAQIWFALARAMRTGDRFLIQTFDPIAAGAQFAVKVQLRPPNGRQPVWGGLVKGIFDGVICAFHTDPAVPPEVAARLAATLRGDKHEIDDYLRDPHWAVLGPVGNLVSPYRTSVKWNPADHLCNAGELLAADPDGANWSMKGELVELAT